MRAWQISSHTFQHEADGLWDEVVKFHGHSCVGLALGFRVAEAALNALGCLRDEDEELVAIVENDSCAVDAIQYLTGCTLGKGNLIFLDYGKQGYTFILREQKKAVRVTVNSIDNLRLKSQGKDGGCSNTELQGKVLTLPLNEICSVSETKGIIPEKARIFASVTCSSCGETVMEPRARLRQGKTVCLPCAGHYVRWANGEA